VYRKLIVRDGRLVGAMLVGDADTAAALVRVFERGDRLPANRLDLFASGEAAAPAGGDTVCQCHQVSETVVRDAIRGGGSSLKGRAAQPKAGTGCGSCRGRLPGLLLQATRHAELAPL